MSAFELMLNKTYSLPQGWQWASIEELFDVQQGIAMSPERREGFSPHPFLRTLNILWGRVDLSTLDEMDFSDEEIIRLSLKPDDLLVCEGGEVGRTAIWRGELESCLYQNHIHRLRRLNDAVVPDFYLYWMQAAYQVFGLYRDQGSMTTISNLSGNRLRSFKVPLPPVEEQEQIAAKVQELTAEAEYACSAGELELKAARALPSAYLRHVFGSDEAKKWERRRLGEVASVFSGSSAPQDPRYFQDGVYPFVRVQDLGRVGRTLRLSGVQDKVNDIAVKELSLSKAEAGVVLFPKSGAAIHTNNRAILDIDAYIVSHLAAVRPNEDVVSSEWIYFWLCTQNMADYSDNIGYPSLRLSVIKSMTIPLPPLSTQQHLASELRDKIADAEELQAAIEKQLETIKALPQAVLRKAFSREL